MASTELLLNTRRPVEEMKKTEANPDNSMDWFDFSKRELKIGQWVDVKDTINQWLEAQIVDVRNNKAYVHYNGWGTRWDEWIDIKSQRIALFRTHTIQSATSAYLSPCPNSPPDAVENVSMDTPSDTTLENFSKIIELSSKSLMLMKQLKSMKSQYNKRVKIQKDKKYQLQDKNLEKIEEEFKMQRKEETKEEIDEDQEEFERKDFKEMADENSELHQQIMLLTGQLAPIMDRVGRMYTDFSPHLLKSVNTYNTNISTGEERNRDRRDVRHRTYQPRRARRNRDRSDDSSDLSSDSLSRGSDESSDNGEEERNQERRDSNNEDRGEIRSRLRSISNTINRIRSSISSMRSMIYNNLGVEGDSSVNESQVEEREERKTSINAQVPIIASPGDIASVHNIFDRFVDRQMVNVMGGEGLLRNRNNNNPNNNPAPNNEIRNSNPENANNGENNGNSTDPSPLNRNDTNRNNQRNQEEENNNSNDRGLNSIRQNLDNLQQEHEATGDSLMELLGADRGGLGLLGNAIGGLGGFGSGGLNTGGMGAGGSDTIELHIHAFMPNGSNGPENPANRNENPNNPLQINLNSDNPARNMNERNEQELIINNNEEENEREEIEERTPRFVDASVQTNMLRIRRDRRERNRGERPSTGVSLGTNPFESNRDTN